MTFWCGSGSADPCLLLMDPDPDPDLDPSIFIIYFQDANKKLIFKKSFPAYYFLSGSGSIPLTNRSGSRRLKNMWIRWIRIRIRNTACNAFVLLGESAMVLPCWGDGGDRGRWSENTGSVGAGRSTFSPVFRIHDILVDPDPWIHVSD
jgi:hypothetical protein